MADPVCVLHVDDDPAITEVVAELLSREDEAIEVTTATGAREGLDRLADGGIDCVVSDYDMPGRNGIEFLETVREEYGEMPFILFTGKGSEEIASEAIAAGVTGYLQKKSGTDQYTLLANRITKAVEAAAARERSRRRKREYRTLIESLPVSIVVVDEEFEILYLNPSAVEQLGIEGREQLVGTPASEFLHPADSEAGMERTRRVFAEREPVDPREYRILTPAGETRHVRGNVVPVTFEGEPAAQIVFADVTEQKDREAALEQERRRFSALFEQFPEPTIAYGYGENQPLIRAVNDAFVETFGYDADTAIGAVVKELVVPPEKRDEAAEIGKQVRAGERVDRTVYRQTATGDRWFNLRNVPLTGIDDIDGYAIYTDVHDQVRRENQFKTLHDGTRRLLSAENPDAVAETMADVAKEILGYEFTAVRFVDEATANLEPVAVTEEARELLGERPSHGLDGDSPHARAYQEGAPIVYDDVRAVSDGEDRGPVRSAMYLPIADDGVVAICDPAIGVFDRSDVEIASILTANAQAALDRLDRERETQRVKERFQAFVEHASDVITLLDGTGVVQYQSPAVERVIGYGQEELVGENIFEYVHPEDRERVGARFAELVEGDDDAETVSIEFRLRCADGEWIWIEAIGSRRYAAAVDGYVVTSRDITDRKERERELQRQNDRLDAFASVVSHDLRNPLNVAQARLELATTECESDHLDDAVGAIQRMESILEDTLELARHGRTVVETEPVDLSDIVAECRETSTPDAARIELEDDVTLRGHPSRLKQVFENLFRNAVEHGSAGPDSQARQDSVEHGSTTSRTETDDAVEHEDPGVTIRVGTIGTDGIYVADDGPGIPESERDAVFDPGYSSAENGSGFGLAIVREIVKAHGWTIAITESESGGTRFEITGVDKA